MLNLSFLFLCSFSLFAQTSFTKGSGSQFKLSMAESGSADLTIYVSESSFTRLGVEYYFSTQGLLPLKMWQQFIFKIEGKGPLNIEAGYIKTPELTHPEALTVEYLNVNKGVEVNDFLFTDKSEIEKFKKGDEKIEVPGGNVLTSHYRKERNGQTVDFWISDLALPIGLVKLVSKSKTDMKQNYTIELVSLLKNVKAEIDPTKAVPLTEKGRSVLASPLKK